jgi:predicted secreted protein
LLVAASAQRTVSVTGSNHIAADVHEFQPGVITASSFALDAIDSNALAQDAADKIAETVQDLEVLTRLNSMIESDGGGQFRYDTIALSMADGGGGGGDASQATLLLVKAKTDLIVAGLVQYTSPVNSTGAIAKPIFRGDDYKASIGNAFAWNITARTGYVVATSTCRFGGSNATTGNSWNVAGTVSDNGDGTWKLSFDMNKTITAALGVGFYQWTVELINAGADEVTEVYNATTNGAAEVRNKQT